MKFLYNPTDGAPIRKVWLEGVQYFTDEAFEIDTILQLDDNLADFLLRIFEFLKEVSKDEAAKLATQKKEEFKCDVCDFKTTAKIGLISHKKIHEKDSNYVPGIKTVRIENAKKAMPTGEQTIKKWEEQDEASGLEGEGLVRDTV
jgi:hypothetical protein